MNLTPNDKILLQQLMGVNEGKTLNFQALNSTGLFSNFSDI
jgi:hypothetical protein